MGIFIERERCCEATFRDGGPYWHAYTSGKETPLLFAREEDLVFVMNVVAQAAALFPEVRIIAFEVMNNHFHFVVSADGPSPVRCSGVMTGYVWAILFGGGRKDSLGVG